MRKKPCLQSADVHKMAAACRAEAEKNKWSVTVAIVDDAGVLLYLFGAGPVKGFGVTLAIGVGASFFTAIMLTRIQVVYWWRWTRPKKLPIVRAVAPAAA